MWNRLLDRFLHQLVQRGTLTLTTPNGLNHDYGDGNPPRVHVTLHDPALPRKLVLDPDLAVGEAYMDGTLTVAGDDLHALMELALTNMQGGHYGAWQLLRARLRGSLRWWKQFNPAGRSRRNVAHHYDLSGALYDLFLDADQQYSCAYFRGPQDTLEQAQAQKKSHIAGKLLLEPGMTVLDIGCGWGGMALKLARDHGARVLGVTLSEEQFRIATERAHRAGLSERVTIKLMDYRAVTGQFDRVVSVGMFEHVGAPQFRTYFRTLRERLAPDGVALIHTIGRTCPPGASNPWITKYIFPGGYIPAMSEVMAAIEKEGLVPCDVEVWRLHYAETLRHWHTRFMANIDQVRRLYDDRFCRMWRYYLVGSEQSFRHSAQCVFQFQLARDIQAVPITRDYLYPATQSAARNAAE